MKDRVRHYLERYAERAPTSDLGHFARGLVIPSFAEGEGILNALASVESSTDTLVVMVLNEPTPAPEWAAGLNEETLAAMARYAGSPRSESESLQVYDSEFGTVCVLLHTGPRALPPKQGVGLARKIGGDFLLRQIAVGRVELEAVAFTDADARLPRDYFTRLEAGFTSKPAAVVFPFEHDCDDPSHRALVDAYDTSLRYYVAGLAHAGSPYAFHTVGSTIAASADAYAAVRGVPRRSAAEDFYFLNKLAKVGPISTVEGEPILLSGRTSRRVPFGTGAAITRWAAEKRTLGSLELYDPTVFSVLRETLHAVRAAFLERLAPARAVEQALAGFSAPVRDVVMGAGVVRRAERAGKQSADPSRAERHFHDAFDGFQTVKLIHSLRDNALPNLAFQEAIERAGFAAAGAGMPRIGTVANDFGLGGPGL